MSTTVYWYLICPWRYITLIHVDYNHTFNSWDKNTSYLLKKKKWQADSISGTKYIRGYQSMCHNIPNIVCDLIKCCLSTRFGHRWIWNPPASSLWSRATALGTICTVQLHVFLQCQQYSFLLILFGSRSLDCDLLFLLLGLPYPATQK